MRTPEEITNAETQFSLIAHENQDAQGLWSATRALFGKEKAKKMWETAFYAGTGHRHTVDKATQDKIAKNNYQYLTLKFEDALELINSDNGNKDFKPVTDPIKILRYQNATKMFRVFRYKRRKKLYMIRWVNYGRNRTKQKQIIQDAEESTRLIIARLVVQAEDGSYIERTVPPIRV